MAFLIGIIVSFCVYVSIGIFLFRKVKSSEEYYVSGRSGNTLMITGTLVASFLSTVSFMGEAGFSYEGYPILLLILVIFNASGYIFGVFLFGRYLRRSKSLTVPEYFGNRFHSKKVRLALLLLQFLAYLHTWLLLLKESSGFVGRGFWCFISDSLDNHVASLFIIYDPIWGERRYGK